jgi:cystathionine beta-lyase
VSLPAHRLQGNPLPTVAELRRRTGSKWTLYPPDVLPAWIADMDFPAAPAVRRAVLAALDRGDLGYPDFESWGGLPQAFATRMESRYGWRPDPARVVLVGDVVQSIYLALQTCTDPGDGVLVQTPVYPPFLQAVAETGRLLLDNPLRPGPDRYEMDPGGWRDLSRARLLLLCNPHNPTGRVLERAELETLAELVLAQNLIVVSDEIHAEITWAGHTHVPFATMGDEVGARTITLTSATKAFNIAGLRCSVAHFGSDELLGRFRAIPYHQRGWVGSLGVAATMAAWQEGEEWQRLVMGQLEENRRLLGSLLEDCLPGAPYLPPEATYLAWLDCRQLGVGPDPWRHFLDRGKVALSNGADFGSPGRGHVRLNFATSPAILTEVVERMGRSLGERKARGQG